MRFHDSPIKEFREVTGPLTKAVLNLKGARFDKRVRGVSKILSTITSSLWQKRRKHDPLKNEEIEKLSLNEQISSIKVKTEEEMNKIRSNVLELSQEGNYI